MAGEQPPLLEIAVGTEGFRLGELTVAVRPGGAVSVVQRRPGETRAWSTRADDDGFVDLATLTSGRGDGAPDDEPVVVRAGGRTVQLHWSDRFSSPAVDALLRRWEHLATTATLGELP